jgi:hypothetical protein
MFSVMLTFVQGTNWYPAGQVVNLQTVVPALAKYGASNM